MNPIDFTQHNEEVAQVWESYRAGHPIRVPFGPLGINPRIWVLDPRLNTEGITWEQFSNDPELMFQTCLKYSYYVTHTIPQDCEMGVPRACWEIHNDFGNVWEEAWFGCQIIYPQGQVSATLPRYTGSRKEGVFERGMPGPFDGFAGQIRDYYEYFVDRASSYAFYDRPVRVLAPYPLGTDGPFTVAFGLRGPELLEDMLLDEDYYHRLMDFIVTAIVERVQAWRVYLGEELRPVRINFADDAIQYLSLRHYRDLILPYHKRLFSALYGEGPHAMHLCGNVQRHLGTIARELNVNSFDTGFPIDFSTLREEVGDKVEIQGGVQVGDLLQRTAAEVFSLSEKILKSGIFRGKRFIFKEANNLPPQTPIANIEAMYAAARTFGRYED